MEVIIKRKNNVPTPEGNDIDSKLRVVAYARVSTEEERQKGSFESQKKYYYEKITSNPEWTFKGIYADEGISGVKSVDRMGFVKMMRDAKNKKFDLILTKSISRFARNTVDTLKFVRFLRERNIGLYFEEENINTNTIQGEMLITILGSLAQQEIENMSAHILRGIEMSIKNGKRKTFIACFGYDYNSKTDKLTPNGDAEKVKLIFELYSKYSKLSKVAKELYERGIKSPRGFDYWTFATISGILTNEKYIGNAVFGKKYVADSLTHKRKCNHGERDIYKYIDNHPPIISKELFDDVQNKYLKRKEFELLRRKKKKDAVSLVSWKGRCGFCSGPMSGRNNGQRINHTYQCNMSLTKITQSQCPNSRRIKETEIISSFLKGMRKLKNKINLNTLDEKVEEKIEYARKILLNAELDKFDFELYDRLVNIIVIGGYTPEGKIDPHMVRIILKEDLIFDEKTLNRRHFKDETIELLSFENRINSTYGFYDKQRNYYKEFIESIRVTIEIQDDDNLIWKL